MIPTPEYRVEQKLIDAVKEAMLFLEANHYHAWNNEWDSAHSKKVFEDLFCCVNEIESGRVQNFSEEKTGHHKGSMADRLERMKVGNRQVFFEQDKSICTEAVRMKARFQTEKSLLVRWNGAETSSEIVTLVTKIEDKSCRSDGAETITLPAKENA